MKFLEKESKRCHKERIENNAQEGHFPLLRHKSHMRTIGINPATQSKKRVMPMGSFSLQLYTKELIYMKEYPKNVVSPGISSQNEHLKWVAKWKKNQLQNMLHSIIRNIF